MKLSKTLKLLMCITATMLISPVPTISQPSLRVPRRTDRFGSESARGLWAELLAVKGAPQHLIVGFKPVNRSRGVWRDTVYVPPVDVSSYVQRLTAVTGVSVLKVDGLLPRAVVEVATSATINAVRALPFIDYIQPRFFRGRLNQSSGGATGCDHVAYPGPRTTPSPP